MNKPVESLPAEKLEYLRRRTDKYFSKSRQIVEKFGDRTVTYGVFLHRGVICAVNPAIDVLRSYYSAKAEPLRITRLYEEGAFVPDQKALFTYTGSFAALVELETLILQRVGVACVSAYNAYKMAMNLKKVAFIDMHARHSPGDDLSLLAAYGASVGSRMAKLGGAIGFIGSSQDLTAHFYGHDKGIGTMPHGIIGYAGSTLRAAQMYVETHPQDNLTVLIDYYGREYSDALDVCRWWYNEYLPRDETGARALALRIDTHGERYAESLDYEKSTEIVVNWLHVPNEYEAVRYVMGEEAFDADSLNIVKDRVRKVLFGTGVSVAAVIQLRQTLDANGFNACKIVGSSGFTLFKCKMFANCRAPLDVVGTGSFIPENFNDTFATADIFMYDGKAGTKLGRALDRSGHPNPVPRIVGKIRRKHAVEIDDLKFLRAHTKKAVKMTVPGPFTMSQQAQNEYYRSEEEASIDYAVAVNEEIHDLFSGGADIVQIDEPYMQARPEKARRYGLAALDRALEGIAGTTAVHICFGYAAVIHVRPSGYSFLGELAGCSCRQVSIETAQSHLDCSVLKTLPGKTIILGVIDLNDMTVETPGKVAARIRRALPFVAPEHVVVAPDCGMKYLPREVAFEKLKAMVEGAKLMRAELGETR